MKTKKHLNYYHFFLNNIYNHKLKVLSNYSNFYSQKYTQKNIKNSFKVEIRIILNSITIKIFKDETINHLFNLILLKFIKLFIIFLRIYIL